MSNQFRNIDTNPNTLNGFVYGSWREVIPKALRKPMIAYALNYCVNNYKLVILGYLITDHRLVLVLNNTEHEKREIFKHLYASINYQIEQYLKEQEKRERILVNDLMLSLRNNEPPLKEYIVLNYELKALLTGHEIGMKFYNPTFEQLKNRLRNNPFCSVISYNGGEGPVIMTYLNLKHAKE